LAQFWAVGQTHQGTIDAHQPVSSPALDRVLRTIDNGQHAISIQLDEGAVFEFGPSVSHRATADRLKDLASAQIIEKFVQVALDRFDSLLQHKKYQHRKSQLALPGEILGSHSMASPEVFIAQLSAQSFDESCEIVGNGMKNSLHPQLNGRTTEKVQAK